MDPAPITGLSFYCGHHTILAAFSGSIREYSKEGLLTGVLQQTGSGGYSSVLSLYPYYAVVQTCENTQFIRIFSAQGQMAECYCFAGSYAIETILVTPYTEAADTTVIQMCIRDSSYTQERLNRSIREHKAITDATVSYTHLEAAFLPYHHTRCIPPAAFPWI